MAAGGARAEEIAAVPTAAEAGETIRFLPIIGAPVEAVTPLSKRLGAEARTNGLTVIAFADGVALAAESFGVSAEAHGAVFKDGAVTLLGDNGALSKIVGAIA